ncbi:MAG: hypothetical protein U1C70_11590 [Sediminibacterium sp.]|jgi:hypothetical protein|uniref:hypothetical protein n=1 Tax=Sediminibacterium sp. TaxID=1917865 RepID=UPI002ABB0640|nr:hypothetical protein [Sediminibacterium sp.]MDZ4072459.1 hypothetical protein [Sediminibacterium sp.]
MKYLVSMLIAAFIFALMVFAIVYWLLEWGFTDSMILGAITFFVGLLGEVARFFLLKKRSNSNNR